MERLEQKALLINLIRKMNNIESWTSETHIQKCTYFLEKLLGVPLVFNFVLYKYGPFSFDLREVLADLCADGYVNIEARYPYGASYVVDNSSNIIERVKKEIIEEYEDCVNFIAEKLSKKHVKELERISTALYVKDKYGLQDSDAVQKIVELKPHISKFEAETALGELQELYREAENIGLIS